MTRIQSAATSEALLITLAKYGVGAIIALYLVFWLKQDLQAEVRASRMEHHEMRAYLQAICLGVNKGDRDVVWRCFGPNAVAPTETSPGAP